MFGLSWSELLIIAVVALVAVGPNDLPKAMRTAARWVRAGQKLAREFQGHVDELVREAELEELREKARKAASLSLVSHLESMVDPQRELAAALATPETIHSPAEPAPPAPAGALTEPAQPAGAPAPGSVAQAPPAPEADAPAPSPATPRPGLTEAATDAAPADHGR